MALTPQTAKMKVRVRSAADLAAAQVDSILPGATVWPEAIVTGSEFAGNASWLKLGEARFAWAGAFNDAPANAPAAPAPVGGMDVSRRPDMTIRALNETEIKAVFGSFTYSEAGSGDIKIDGKWASANIVKVPAPWLNAVGVENIWIHKKAVTPFTKVFNAIQAAGLLPLIRQFGGTFYPRHVGHDPNNPHLSSHSWGIAIDLNPGFNPYHHPAAALGTVGSVRELVPFFEAEGFAWGGYFSENPDGMHFELARRDV